MNYKIFALLFFLSVSSFCLSAQSPWTLDSCIAFALENNFTVKQKLLEIEQNKINLHASKMNIFPVVNASVGQNFDFGRAAGANAVIENNSQSTTSMGINLSVPLFQGLQNHYQTASDKLTLKAALLDLEQTRENIALNVTAYFLQVLLYKEIHEMAQQQVELSQMQVSRVEELVKNGKSSNSDLFAMQATLAADELNRVESENAYQLAKLDLALLMNIQDIHRFDVAMSGELDMNILLNKDFDLQAITLYSVENRPGVRAAATRLEKGEKDIKLMQSGWYPHIQLNASYGTGYYHIFQNNLTNFPFNTQMKNNSREMISLSVNIPLFDRLSTFNSVRRTRVNAHLQQLNLEESKRNLEKEIYQAYGNALAAKNKYAAAEKSAAAAELAFRYETLKYEEGKSTSNSYSEAKLKHQRALSEVIQAKYRYALQTRVLEFYGKQ
ncbi:MAG: TolC family protein [Bacteroidales bacterium]|jgi:outer membrane protein|nr:TolC family protein [Bacteroidales bacterium]